MRRLLGVVFVIGFIIIMANTQHNTTPTASPTPPAPTTQAAPEAKAEEAKAEEAKPKEEPPPPTPAIGEEVSYDFFKYLDGKANYECSKQIKRHAEYGIRAPGIVYGTNYNDDILFLRFTHMSRRVDGDGNIFIGGDKAEAQNAAGAWVQVKYTCTVNVKTFAVRDASLDRGRFID